MSGAEGFRGMGDMMDRGRRIEVERQRHNGPTWPKPPLRRIRQAQCFKPGRMATQGAAVLTGDFASQEIGATRQSGIQRSQPLTKKKYRPSTMPRQTPKATWGRVTDQGLPATFMPSSPPTTPESARGS